MMPPLEHIEIATGATLPQASVIWLHGLGADGHDFADIVPQLNLPTDFAIRFIFPHAPVRPVSINAGYPMRAWFDIYGLDEHSKQDEHGIRLGQHFITEFIAQENSRNIPTQRIILAGFSQGGALALYTGLRYPQKLGGIIGLSTFLPFSSRLSLEASKQNRNTPVFLAHGTEDAVVSFRFGEMTRQLLGKAGYAMNWHEYQMGHTVCAKEIQDISQWLQKVIENWLRCK
jgi:phospholipase/carboxylesterase